VIYWHPTYGAWIIRGGILNQWEFIGYEGGTLGYPASDEYVDNGVIKQLFANHLVEFGENDPDPTGPLSRAGDDLLEFYSGDEKRIKGEAGILVVRRNAPQDDSRRLAWAFTISALGVNQAQYGLSTLKDCTSVITSKSHNKTQNLNGNGTWAYGYTMASVSREYYFRIR
ncbi:MAG: cmtH, partial [Rhodococcus erythropolis]|nr:cmtH [Rhodococcus erythropolis]